MEEITDVLVSEVMEEVGEVAKLISQPEEQFVLTQKSGVKRDAERERNFCRKRTRASSSTFGAKRTSLM